MRTVVVGAGPVGLLCALARARDGDEVALVDRDAGPSAEGWNRRGVMQFEHAHYFRHAVRQVLADRLPDVLDELIAAGALVGGFPGMPDELAGLQCRRPVFEGVLRRAAAREPGITSVVGHADDVISSGGRATGVVVDGSPLDAELVLSATGRASRFGDELRAPGQQHDCGISYVDRVYQARPGADWPAVPVDGELYDGYQAIAFPHDNRTLSTVVIRRSDDQELMALRDDACFDAAVGQIPVLAPWTDPAGWVPLTGVMVGGRLINSYRGQHDESGRIPLPGLVFLGDAVCTTNPSAGRGVSLGMSQADQLLSLAEQHSDAEDLAEAFDAWCTAQVRPWYDEHVARDSWLLRRFAGHDLDPEGPLTCDVVVEACQDDPAYGPLIGPYLGMLALPDSLAPLEGPTRARLRAGWRPAYASGPSRDELVATVQQASRTGSPASR